MATYQERKEPETEEIEGATATTTQQFMDFADTMSKTSAARLSLEGQLGQALISLERYIDCDEQLLHSNEMLIPKFALSKAKGIVFLSIIKGGFLVGGCIGTGCVMVKNDCGDGQGWSGPSSIVCAGLSVGLLAGASKVDYIMILPNRMAVKSFMSTGQLRIGGGLSVTLGSVGRDAYSNIGAGNVGGISVVYSYAHSKGLYGGISLHGKVLSVRNECNQQFYGFEVHNEAILCGDVSMSFECLHYQRIVHILHSYCCGSDETADTPFAAVKTVKLLQPPQCIQQTSCTCKLCHPLKAKAKTLSSSLSSLSLEESNPFHLDVNHTLARSASATTLARTNPFCTAAASTRTTTTSTSTSTSTSTTTTTTTASSLPCLHGHRTINQLQKMPKISAKACKTKISVETFLERTPSPSPPPALSATYEYSDDRIQIIGDNVILKTDDHDPWKSVHVNQHRKPREPHDDEDVEDDVEVDADLHYDPYALHVRAPKRSVESRFADIMQQQQQKQTTGGQACNFRIDSDDDGEDDEDDDLKTAATQTQPQQQDKESNGSQHRHYSDYNVSRYSLENYDKDGCRIQTFSLLFQIDRKTYETKIRIAGKLVSKQYIVNWPTKYDCKAVVIVTCKRMSNYFDGGDGDGDDSNDYELRLICYDERDDDLIVHTIDIRFSSISQIVNTINGAFVVNRTKPWIVLESVFNAYDQKMYESMIDASRTWHHHHDGGGVLRYGDLIRLNFGSLCQYGLYVGENEVVCYQRRFPNNGSSAFKKLRLFLLLFSGGASKKIKVQHTTMREFITDDVGRVEVIFYPLPCISPMLLVKKALIATDNHVQNCVCEYSPEVEAKRTVSTKDILQDRMLNVIDGITATVNIITDAANASIL